jgi:hypothetical protein
MFNIPSINPLENIKNSVNHINNVSDLVFKGKSNYPVSVKNSLSRYGNNKITRIILVRKPLSTSMNMALDVFSGFKYMDKLKQSPYDKLFHLSAVLILDNRKKLVFEKVETMSLKEFSGNPFNQKGTENLEITNIPPDLKVINLVENTKKLMGDNKFFTYNSSSNNCQNFLVNMVRANIPNYEPYINFIKQDTEFVFKNNPVFRKFANTLTSTGRVLGVLMGKGVKDKPKVKKTNNWIEFVKQYAEEHNLSYREAMKEAKNHYQSGGSLKSNFVRHIIYKENFNPDLIKGNIKSKNISSNPKIKTNQNKTESKKPFRKKLQEKGIFLDDDLSDDEEHIIDKYYETNVLNIYKSIIDLLLKKKKLKINIPLMMRTHQNLLKVIQTSGISLNEVLKNV